MWNRSIRTVIILGMIVVICGMVNAVAVGVVAETQATSAGEYPVCTAPCECISESTAGMRWGAQGYEKCSKTICGQDANGDIQYYCIHKAGSVISAAGSTPAALVMTGTPAITTKAPVTTSQEKVNAVVTPAAVVATPSPALLETGAVTRKSPAGIATILAAIGALLVTAGVRRK